MSIATAADLRAACRQRQIYFKPGFNSNSNSGVWTNMIYGPGTPGAVTVVSNNTTGVVPTGSTSGYLPINAFSGKAYLSAVEFTSGTVARFLLYDRLFEAGSFAAGSGTTTLGSQPSYSARVPGGNDFSGTQLWIEGGYTVTPPSTVTVTYTDQAGNAGHSTGALAIAMVNSSSKASALQLPLQAGDTGIQVVESVTVAGTATGNGYSIAVVRPLWRGAATITDRVYRNGLFEIGFPEIFSNSALGMYLTPIIASSNSAQFAAEIEIASN